MSRYLIYVTDKGQHDLREEVQSDSRQDGLQEAVQKLAAEELAHRRKLGSDVVKQKFQLSVFEVDSGLFVEIIDFDALKNPGDNVTEFRRRN